MAEHYRGFLRRPSDVPAVVLGNAALMCGGWFLLPPLLRAWLFTLHGPLAFPVVLAAWMMADTPATNVLADQGITSDVLRDRRACRRWVAARSGALGLLVGLPCLVVALVLGAVQGHWGLMVLAGLAVLAAPVGVLPLVAWLGLLLPYRPRPLLWRWEHRRVWRTQLRWVLLVLTPYVVVPAVATVLVIPALAVELTLTGPTLELAPGPVVLVGLTLVLTMLVAGLLGLAGVARITECRRARLTAFLSDPDAG